MAVEGQHSGHQHPGNALVIGLRAQGATLGVASPPHCLWTVEPAMSVPSVYSSDSRGANLSTDQLVPVPNIAELAGLRIHAQNAALLQYPAGLLVFPSVAMEFVIGDSHTPSGGVVAATGDRCATMGTVDTAGPVSVRLQ